MTKPRRGRRAFSIAGIAVVAIALLWSGYWFAASRTASAAFARANAAAAARGLSLGCKDASVGGYPLRLDLSCPRATLAGTGQELSGAVDGLSATAPLYWPGHVEAQLGGPVVLDAPGLGVAVSARWTAANAVLDAGLGGITGSVLDFTGLDLTNGGAAGRLPIKDLAAAHLRLVTAPGGGDYHVTATAEKLRLTQPDGKVLPEVDGEVRLTALKLGNALGTNPRQAIRDWLAGGGTLQVDQMSLAAGGLWIDASGSLTLSADGLLSGKLTVQFIGLEALPDLVDQVRPGHRNDVENGVKMLGAVTLPVATDRGEARQTVIVIRNGLVAVGIFPVGLIPPIRF
jgi:hypothetical protein